VLYCPQCGAEYREGYSSCSDCHVLLVRELPENARESNPEPGDPNKDPFCSFWQGTDARICAELRSVLDEAGIPHKTIHREDHLFNIANQVPYQIGVPASLFEKAELAVQEAFGDESEEISKVAEKLLPDSTENVKRFGTFSEWLDAAAGYAKNALGEVHGVPPEPEVGMGGQSALIGVTAAVNTSSYNPDDWFPEDATSELWSGDRPELREIIEMSLHENDIRARWEGPEERPVVFVLPQDEPRAREIIREIVEAAPPE
jgi:hypothetical protein